MPESYLTNGEIRKGKLYIVKKREMDEQFQHWRDCAVTVRVQRKRKTRSLAQLAWYWPVVIPRCTTVFNKDPTAVVKFDDKQTHEMLKALFMDPSLVLAGLIRGRIMNGLVIGSTTRDLNTLQFIEFTERIVMWAAERDIVIPDPDPQWREHALEEARQEEDAA